MKEHTPLKHHQQESIRAAIGREIARLIEIDDRLAEAKAALDAATAAYKQAIRDAAERAVAKF